MIWRRKPRSGPTEDPEAVARYAERLAARAGQPAIELEAAREQLARANEELRNSEAQIRLLLDSTAEGIYGLDLEGRFTFVNAACARLLGYGSPDELLGRGAHDLIHHTRPDGSLCPAGECHIYRALRDGESLQLDREVLWRSDWTSFSAEVWCHPMLREGRSVGSVVTFVDVSRPRQLEAQLRAAQKMEAIGRLAGGIAHDFNNLLTVILGHSALLLGRMDASDALRDGVGEIQAAGERAAALTQQLLAFGRRQILEPVVLDLNTSVHDLEKMLRRLIGENVEIVSRLDLSAGRVKADRGQIEQVITNLVVNARDAMPDGGAITIETGNVELDLDYVGRHSYVAAGRYVMLAVSDTGTGMDVGTQARAFEPFFTTKAAGKGTGLGLSTVYGIIKQSGGSVEIYSEIARGTTIKVYLPRVDEDAASPALRRGDAPAAGGRETILLAEDDPAVRALARRVLAGRGYTVLEAASGDEAIAVSEAHAGSIHMIVTDMVMPGGGGSELVKVLAARRPEIRALYVSGYTTGAMFRNGLLDGPGAFLQKPFTPESLARKVREVLDSAPA